MAVVSNSLQIKHGLSLWCPQSASINRTHWRCSIGLGNVRRRSYVAASSAFANENREWGFDCNLSLRLEIDLIIKLIFQICVFFFFRFVIVGGGNAAGYAARTFVEHGMANGRLCIVSKEASLAQFLAFELLVSLITDCKW